MHRSERARQKQEQRKQKQIRVAAQARGTVLSTLPRDSHSTDEGTSSDSQSDLDGLFQSEYKRSNATRAASNAKRVGGDVKHETLIEVRGSGSSMMVAMPQVPLEVAASSARATQ